MGLKTKTERRQKWFQKKKGRKGSEFHLLEGLGREAWLLAAKQN